MHTDPAPVPENPAFDALSPAELLASEPPATNWLWSGYLAPGNVTLLTSPWKAGKTTLTAALLAQLGSGAALAGQPVRPGAALVVSEESKSQWRRRCAAFGFHDQVSFLCRPFRGKPRPDEWAALLDHLLALRSARPLDLLVIDPLAAFLPGKGESDAGSMLAALLPLQRLTAAGMAVLILHHPRKHASADGQWARGSGALSGYVDILLEMHYYSSPSDDDRRRKLLAFSRYDETPRRQVIALNEAGTGWDSLGDFEDEAFARDWTCLRRLLEDAKLKLTQADILADWPADTPAPSQPTLSRWLARALAERLVLREGAGRKNDPYRFWLPGQEERWQHGPDAKDLAQIDVLRGLLGDDWANKELRRLGGTG